MAIPLTAVCWWLLGHVSVSVRWHEHHHYHHHVDDQSYEPNFNLRNTRQLQFGHDEVARLSRVLRQPQFDPEEVARRFRAA